MIQNDEFYTLEQDSLAFQILVTSYSFDLFPLTTSYNFKTVKELYELFYHRQERIPKMFVLSSRNFA